MRFRFFFVSIFFPRFPQIVQNSMNLKSIILLAVLLRSSLFGIFCADRFESDDRRDRFSWRMQINTYWERQMLSSWSSSTIPGNRLQHDSARFNFTFEHEYESNPSTQHYAGSFSCWVTRKIAFISILGETQHPSTLSMNNSLIEGSDRQ